MDASEFTTLDEIGEDEDASKVKSNIESCPKFNSAAEEIDYLNKVLKRLENENIDNCDNSSVGDYNTLNSDKNFNSIPHNKLKSPSEKNFNEYENNISIDYSESGKQIDFIEEQNKSSNLNSGILGECSPLSPLKNIPENVINDKPNTRISAECFNEINVDTYESNIAKKSPQHCRSLDDKPNLVPNKPVDLLNNDELVPQKQSQFIDKIQLDSTEYLFDIETQTALENKGVKVLPSQEFSQINTFPIPLSEIKAEPFDTDMISLQDYFNDPAEQCDLSDFDTIKEEFQTLPPETALHLSNLHVSNTSNNLDNFGYESIKKEPLSLESLIFQLPEVRFKVKKNYFYSKEELDAAMLMSMSSLARVMHMDMFADHRNNFPKINMFLLDDLQFHVHDVPDDDLDILVPFFNIYGFDIQKWIKKFKIKRNYARKKSGKKQVTCNDNIKKHGNRAEMSFSKKYSTYYKALRDTPSPASDIDFEGFHNEPQTPKAEIIDNRKIDISFGSDSDSEDGVKFNVAACLSLIESPIKSIAKVKAPEVVSTPTIKTKMSDRSSDDSAKRIYSVYQPPTTHDISKITSLKKLDDSIPRCNVQLFDLSYEIAKYEKALHMENCKVVNCKGSCESFHRLVYQKDEISPQKCLIFEKCNLKSQCESRKNQNLKDKFSISDCLISSMEIKVDSKFKPVKEEISKEEIKSASNKVKHKKFKNSCELKSEYEENLHVKPNFKSKSGVIDKPRNNNEFSIKKEVQIKQQEKSTPDKDKNVEQIGSYKTKFINHSKMSSLNKGLPPKINDNEVKCKEGFEKFIDPHKHSSPNKDEFLKCKEKIETTIHLRIDDGSNATFHKSNDKEKGEGHFQNHKVKTSIKEKYVENCDIESNITSNISTVKENQYELKNKDKHNLIEDKTHTEMSKLDDKPKVPPLVNELVESLTFSTGKASVVHQKSFPCKSCTICLKNILYDSKYRKLVKRQLRHVLQTQSVSRQYSKLKESLINHQSDPKKPLPKQPEQKGIPTNHYSDIKESLLDNSSKLKEVSHKHSSKQREVFPKHDVKETFPELKEKCKQESLILPVKDVLPAKKGVSKHSKHEKYLNKAKTISKMIHHSTSNKSNIMEDAERPTHSKNLKPSKNNDDTHIKNFPPSNENLHKSNFRIPKKQTSNSATHSPVSLLAKRSAANLSHVPSYRNKLSRSHQDEYPFRTFNIGEKFKPQSKPSEGQETQLVSNKNDSQSDQDILMQHDTFGYRNSLQSKATNMPAADQTSTTYNNMTVNSTDTPTINMDAIANCLLNKAIDGTKESYTSAWHTKSCESAWHTKSCESSVHKQSYNKDLVGQKDSEKLDNATEQVVLTDNIDCVSIGGESSPSCSQRSAEKSFDPRKPISTGPKFVSAKEKIRALVSLMNSKEKRKMYVKYKYRYIAATKAYSEMPMKYVNSHLKAEAYKDLKRKRMMYYDLKIYLNEERKEALIKSEQSSGVSNMKPSYQFKSGTETLHDASLTCKDEIVMPNTYSTADISEADAPYSPSGSICDAEHIAPYSPSVPIDKSKDENLSSNSKNADTKFESVMQLIVEKICSSIAKGTSNEAEISNLVALNSQTVKDEEISSCRNTPAIPTTEEEDEPSLSIPINDTLVRTSPNVHGFEIEDRASHLSVPDGETEDNPYSPGVPIDEHEENKPSYSPGTPIVEAADELNYIHKTDDEAKATLYSPSAPHYSPEMKTRISVDDQKGAPTKFSDHEDRSPSVSSVHSDLDRYSLSSMSIDSDADDIIDQSAISTSNSFMGQVNMPQFLNHSSVPESPEGPDSSRPTSVNSDQTSRMEIPLLNCFLLPPPPLPTLTHNNLECDVEFMRQFGVSKDDFSSSYISKGSLKKEKKKPISSLFNDLCNEWTKKGASDSAFSHSSSGYTSQHETSDDALSKFEKEIELLLEETNYFDVEPLAQPLINKANGFPLVGLQYVLEVQRGGRNVESCSYICSLCSKKMSSDTLIAHVKSVPHRLKFSSFHALDLNSTYGTLELAQWTADLVRKFTIELQKLESVCGRQRMAVCNEKTVPSAISYLKNRAKDALANLKHENRNKPKQEAVDISSMVASIMEMPKKSVKDINQLLPSKRASDLKRKPETIDLSKASPKKGGKRILADRSPIRQSGKRQRSPVSRVRCRSPITRRRSRSPASSRSPWRDISYPKASRSPVALNRSPVSRRSRSPLRPKWSRSPLRQKRSRSPFSKRQSRSPAPRRRSRSPRDSLIRSRSPMAYRKRRSPVSSKLTKIPNWSSHSPAFGRRSISPARRPARSRSPVMNRNDYDRDKNSRSPDRCPPASLMSAGDLKKITEFKAEENELKLDHFAAFESYLSEPESHPKYKVEWNMFWEKRTQDLRRQGITPASYDFTDEWTTYWRKKLTILCDNDFNEKQTKLVLRYNFDKRTMAFLQNTKLADELMIKCNEARPLESEVTRSSSPWEGLLQGGAKDRSVYEEEFTVYGTLKILTELEDQLGSLGVSIGLLFAQTKELLNKSKNPVTMFDDKDNRVLLKLSIGKLASLLASGVLDPMSQAKTHMAIEHCNWLQKEIETTFPEMPNFIAGLDIATIAQSTLGMGHVQIAAYIAKQLMHIGSTNATETDLNSILNAVSSHHSKIAASNILKESILTTKKPSFNPVSQSHGNGFEKRPALFPSGTDNSHVPKASEMPKPSSRIVFDTSPQSKGGDRQDDESSGALSLLMTSYEDNIRTIDELSLEELQERLMNFSSLNPNDQQELTEHLKKLEATDSKKVTKLRTMMRNSMKSAKPAAKPATVPPNPQKKLSTSDPPTVRDSDEATDHSRNLTRSVPTTVAAPYNSTPSNIYNKPTDSYTVAKPADTYVSASQHMKGHGEHVGDEHGNDNRHNEYTQDNHYRDEREYPSHQVGFNTTDNRNEPSMMSEEAAPFPPPKYSPRLPASQTMTPNTPIQHGPRYRAYTPDNHHHSGLQPGGLRAPSRPWHIQGGPDYRPRLAAQDHRHRLASSDHRPRLAGPDHGPRMSGPDHRPRLAGPDHRPRMSGPDHRPRMGGPDQRPRMSGPDHRPRMSGPDQRPRTNTPLNGGGYRLSGGSFGQRPRGPFNGRHMNAQRFPIPRGRFDAPMAPYGRFSRPY